MNWAKKKVLVTGGAGFLGLNLVRKLCSVDSEVTVMDNFSVGSRRRIKDYSVTVLDADVLDRASLASVDDIDFIFHLGSPSSVILFNKSPQHCFRETTEGWMNILNLGKRVSVKKMVFPSTGSLYGRASPPHAETKNPCPCNLYAVSKLACEQITETLDSPPPTVILRIFAGYGPDEDHKGSFASPVTLFLKSIANDEKPAIYGDGSQSRDFVYVDDVIEAMMRSAESSFEGVINVGSGVTHSFNEVVGMLNDKLDKRINAHYIPRPANYLEKTLADVSRMKSVLGIDPLTLEEGIDRYFSQVDVP